MFRDASLASGRSPRLEPHVSVLVADGRIAWIRPTDAEDDPGPKDGLTVVDARGAAIVPGLVDAHSHIVLPGGPDYVEHRTDPPAQLLDAAEQNGLAAWRAGIRWLRDVGSPIGIDPFDRRRRALALGVRERWLDGLNARPCARAGRGLRRLAAARLAPALRSRTPPTCLEPPSDSCGTAPIS